MKSIIAFILALSLCGCADMTPREKQFAKISIGILIVGAIYSHRVNHEERCNKKNFEPINCDSDPYECR